MLQFQLVGFVFLPAKMTTQVKSRRGSAPVVVQEKPVEKLVTTPYYEEYLPFKRSETKLSERNKKTNLEKSINSMIVKLQDGFHGGGYPSTILIHVGEQIDRYNESNNSKLHTKFWNSNEEDSSMKSIASELFVLDV